MDSLHQTLSWYTVYVYVTTGYTPLEACLNLDSDFRSTFPPTAHRTHEWHNNNVLVCPLVAGSDLDKSFLDDTQDYIFFFIFSTAVVLWCVRLGCHWGKHASLRLLGSLNGLEEGWNSLLLASWQQNTRLDAVWEPPFHLPALFFFMY